MPSTDKFNLSLRLREDINKKYWILGTSFLTLKPPSPPQLFRETYFYFMYIQNQNKRVRDTFHLTETPNHNPPLQNDPLEKLM